MSPRGSPKTQPESEQRSDHARDPRELSHQAHQHGQDNRVTQYRSNTVHVETRHCQLEHNDRTERRHFQIDPAITLDPQGPRPANPPHSREKSLSDLSTSANCSSSVECQDRTERRHRRHNLFLTATRALPSQIQTLDLDKLWPQPESVNSDPPPPSLMSQSD